MYAGLAMAEEDEVERVFGARYDVIADAAQTNAMYSDLTPETAYMYRVAAVNAVGLGAWSNESHGDDAWLLTLRWATPAG